MNAYAFCQEVVLLYPLYAVLFAEAGLSTAQISTLFLIWSAAGLLAEVPSGVLADALSRRLLLALGPALTAAGFALWTLAPAYPAFAVGFVLWGVGGALQSGALEAVVFEELDRLNHADDYGRVIGRSRAAATVGMLLAMAAAGPVFALGGYALVGVASVLTSIGAAAIGAGFPDPPRARSVGPDGAAGPEGYRALGRTLTRGLAEVRTSARVRGVALLLVVISSLWGALDEYVTLVALEAGVAVAQIPLVVALVYAGVAVGGLLGGVAHRLPRAAETGILAAAGSALVAGALLGYPVGFVLIGVGFLGVQLVEIGVAERLQHTIDGSSRATVTSLAGLGTELATMVVFAGYGLASWWWGHGVVFAVFSAGYLLVAAGRLWPVRSAVDTG